MPPPEVAMRVGRLPGRHHAARPSALVHGYHLDGIQIIRCEAELAAEEAKGATDHMPAHADFRILAERYHYSPPLEQRPERLAHCGAGLDGHGAPFRVVVHALHGRDIDDRSEEHTSELQSLAYLVCRLLLEKKKTLRAERRIAGPA